MDYVKLYTDFLKTFVLLKRPLNVVVDCSNGATGNILERLLPEIANLQFTLINDTPDPEFPAHGPNPLLAGVLGDLSKTVLEKKADFGVVFDADGDRAFFVDNKGRVLQSFVIASLLFKNSPAPFVGDELVYQALSYMNIFSKEELQPSRVGTAFVKQKMQECKASVAAEFSGHYYFQEFFGSDSGIFTFLKVLTLLSKESHLLSAFADSLPAHAISNKDLEIEGKSSKDILARIASIYSEKGAEIERREGITVRLEKGWVNVRPSNTEPILRLYAGSVTEKDSAALLEEVERLI